jgi:hypothetical protein
MARLWMKLYKHHRIAKQATAPCDLMDIEPAITSLCKEFDIPNPLWLNKHENEFSEFRRTTFIAEHFMEDVDFERMEIEYLDDENKKRKSRDPRNQFDGF